MGGGVLRILARHCTMAQRLQRGHSFSWHLIEGPFPAWSTHYIIICVRSRRSILQRRLKWESACQPDEQSSIIQAPVWVRRETLWFTYLAAWWVRLMVTLCLLHLQIEKSYSSTPAAQCWPCPIKGNLQGNCDVPVVINSVLLSVGEGTEMGGTVMYGGRFLFFSVLSTSLWHIQLRLMPLHNSKLWLPFNIALMI